MHLSAGDLLRSEQSRPGSRYGSLISDCIKEGKIVPMHVTISLLSNAMEEAEKNGLSSHFLIDGFPRKMDQCLEFESKVCPCKAALFFDCTEETMLERLLERGKTSGRADDNVESIKKRFRTYIETSMPVISYLRDQDKVITIDANKSKEAVTADVHKAIDSLKLF